MLGFKSSNETYDESTLDEKLIFPHNVYDSLKAQNGIQPKEKMSMILSLDALICFVGGWYLAGFLRQYIPRYYLIVTIAIVVALHATIGVYILRLFTDNSISSEMDNSYKGFDQYFGVYKEIRNTNGIPYNFDVVEMNDGSHVAYIQCLFGYNTQQRSLNTEAETRAVESILCKAGIKHTITYINEDFKGSSAASNMLKPLEGIQDAKLFDAYRSIVQHMVNVATEQSNSVSVVYAITAHTKILKEQFNTIIERIMKHLDNEFTAYREAKVLSYPEIVDFYRRYHKLSVIDMGQLNRKRNVSDAAVSIKVLKVYLKDGTVKTSKDFVKLYEDIQKEQGVGK